MSYPYRRAEKGAPLSATDYDRNVPAQSLAELLADTTLYTYAGGVATGDIFTTALEGFRYQVAASGASDQHLTTAGGLKLYVLPAPDGVFNFKAFNPAANGVTDDYAKLILAISAAASPLNAGFVKTGPAIFFPDAEYFIGSTLELKSSIKLFGHSSGQSWDARATLRWPTNTAGIVINRYDTNGGVIVSPSTTAADTTIIEGLHLSGTVPGTIDITKAGIRLRAHAIIRQCYIEKFSGDGIMVWADTFGDNSSRGNANLFKIEHCSCNTNSRHGIYTQGGDSNAGTVYGCDASYNGRWGYYDNSFLGNTYVGCHCEANGSPGQAQNSSVQSSLTSYLGVQYAAYPTASEADYVATTPGTNSSIWFPQPGTPNIFCVPWTVGQPAGKFFSGGSMRADGLSSRTIFVGTYGETGQAGLFITANNLAIGGLTGDIIYGGSVQGFGGNGLAVGVLKAISGTATTLIGGPPAAGGRSLEFWDSVGDGGWTWTFEYNAGDWIWMNANVPTRIPAWITSTATTKQYGTGAAVPYLFGVDKLGLGAGTDGRRQTYGSSAPGSGTWAKGDIVWNNNAAASGFAGWICTTAGTSGTWKTFGAISA